MSHRHHYGLKNAFYATLLGIIAPGRAARAISSVSGLALLVVLLAWSLVLGLLFLTANVWAQLREMDWMFTGNVHDSVFLIKEKPLALVLEDVFIEPFEGPLTTCPIGAFFTLLLYLGMFTVSGFPRVFPSGRLRPAMERARLAVAAAMGSFALILGMSTIVAALGSDLELEVFVEAPNPYGFQLPLPYYIQTLKNAPLFAILFSFFWASRSLVAMGSTIGEPARDPVCESCGYSLARHHADQRCPECGLETNYSLMQGLSRPGCSWQLRPSLFSWVSTSLGVIRSPDKFYRKLQLRQYVERGCVFAWTHYVLMAMFYGFVYALREHIEQYGAYRGTHAGHWIVQDMIPMAFFSFLFLWLGHHVLILLVYVYARARKIVPDGRWIAVMGDYQTAWLWNIWPILVFIKLIFIGPIFFMPGIPGAPFRLLWPLWPPTSIIEVMVWLIPFMLVVWLLQRYRSNLRRIRWANY